jgi:hypothetical protein
MRKRKINALLVLTIVVVIIFSVYLIFLSPGKNDPGETTVTGTDDTGTETDESTTERKLEINDFFVTDIQKMVVVAKGQTLVMDRVTGTTQDESGSESVYDYYELVEPAGYQLDQTAVTSFASTVAYVTESVYVGKVEDLGQYGLADPVFSVSVTLANGEVHSLDVGDAIMGGDGYYVNVPGTDEVKVVNSYKIDAMLIDLKDLLSKEIFTMDAADVTEFMIKRKGEDQIVAKRKTADELADIRLGFEDFRITEPLVCDGNSSNISTNIETLLSGTVDEFIEFGTTDFSKYGLDDPDYVVGLTDSNGAAMTLEIGVSNEDGTARYCRFKDMDVVFTLLNEDLKLIDMPLEELVSSFIYIVNISNVDGLHVKAEGYDFDCTIDHVTGDDGAKTDVFYINGKDANAVDEDDMSYFRIFFRSLISIATDSFDPDAHPAYDPEISFTFRFDGFSDIKVDYVRKDDYFYYAFINRVYTGILIRNTEFSGQYGLYTILPDLFENLK